MICKKEKCTGCYACYNICPKNAIEMKEDEYGNIYACINNEKCIECKICKKVCPQINEMELKAPLTVYAMYNKDKNIRQQSTSGGAATTFYTKVLKEKGIVYGASNLFGKETFDFIRIDKLDDLYKVKGSKYVHCYIKDTFKKVKEDLVSNKLVLFIGTPCQIAGLKSFLMKEYDNLITVDLVCHGVPSQKLLFDNLKDYRIDKKDIYYITFRDDNGFRLKVYDKDKKLNVSKTSNEDYYYKNFLRGNIYRENCYSCRYARRQRIADITIGDFWGLDKNSKVYDDESKGISLIMPITPKGLELVNSITDESIIEERTIEEATKENQQLNHPMYRKKEYLKYKKYYPKYGYKYAMKKLEKFKDFLKKNKMIYKIYKRIR